MILYSISCKNPVSQFIKIQFTTHLTNSDPFILQLPAWRAGRYQLANYAQNIRGFCAFDDQKNSISFEKTSKDTWMVFPNSTGSVQIEYEYWAGKMDAGSSWADDEQIYVNLVNCCFEILGRSQEEIQVSLDLPEFPNQVSTLRPFGPLTWKATNFQMLADSTILAAKDLTHWEYTVKEVRFNIWIHGEIFFEQSELINRFQAFSKRMIQDFGEFPEPEYHFIFQLLRYPHYHGVEHRRGTVITFGPAGSLANPEEIEELLGVSCHELYHAWNVCRIRPKELLPYDFSKETYTQAGLILEGVTTYMGDLYLLKSGVYDLKTYLRHFEKVILRESMNFGWKKYTIQESSFDLWLDGYISGIPDRKVNIYSRGALLALCLDILLLKGGSSLAAVMKKLWEKFGKPFIGYEWSDFENMVLDELSDSTEAKSFFSSFVYGHEDLFIYIKSLLTEIGIEMTETFCDDWFLHQVGVNTNSEGLISQIHPESKAYAILMATDRIMNWPLNRPENSNTINFRIDRKGRILDVSLELEDEKFYPIYRLLPGEYTPLRKEWLA
jgi:predicted metalloprotease with PDZ domain